MSPYSAYSHSLKMVSVLLSYPQNSQSKHYIWGVPFRQTIGWQGTLLLCYNKVVPCFRDTTFGDYRVVEQDIDGCEMIYCLMKAPFPVSNRDFLQVRLRLWRSASVIT